MVRVLIARLGTVVLRDTSQVPRKPSQVQWDRYARLRSSTPVYRKF